MNNIHMNLPAHGHNRTCCYCQKGVSNDQLTTVPSDESIRKQWIEILGKQFARTLKMYKKPLICLTHFEGNIEQISEYQLPIRMSEEEENEVRKKRGKMSNKKASKRKRKCCYCKKRVSDNQMTTVPSNESVRKQWIEILGKQFARTLNNYKKPLICLTHFEGNIEQRSIYQLPVRMDEEIEDEEDEGENENEEKEEIEDEDEVGMDETVLELKNVSENSDENQRENSDIEQVFSQMEDVQDLEAGSNVSSTSAIPKNNGNVAPGKQEVRKKRRIDSNSEKSSKRGKLGEDMEKENGLVEEQKENDDKLIERQPKLNTFLRNVPKRENEDNGIVIIQSPLNEILGEFGSIEKDVRDQKNQTNSQENGLVEEQKENDDKVIERQPKVMDLLRNVPKRENEDNGIVIIQSPLNEILGEFGSIERDVRDQKNQKNSQEKGLLIVKQEEEGNEHLPRVSIEMDLMPNEIKKPNEEPKKKIDSNSEKQENICRICNIQFNPSIQMIPIPSKKEDLMKFWNVFEQNFIDNILKYPEPHFICMNLEMTNEKQGLKTRCKYCEQQIEMKYMTRVPFNPKIREKWIEVLGPLFLENLKERDNEQARYFGHICLSHFEGNIEQISEYQLPIRMSEEEENEVRKNRGKMSNKNSSKIFCKCCYCKKSLPFQQMTTVPSDGRIRKQWIEILGKRFAENLKDVMQPFICRKHFKGNTERRLKYQLPIRMNKENEDEEDEGENENEEKEEIEDEDEVGMDETVPELQNVSENSDENQRENSNTEQVFSQMEEVQDLETGSNVSSTSAISINNGKRSPGKQEVRNKRKIDSHFEESSKRGELGEEMEKEDGLIEEREENDDKEDAVEMNETIQKFNDIVENVPEKQVENQQENMDIEQVFLMNEVQDVETISIVPSTPKNNGKVASDEQEIRKKRRIDWNSEKSSKRGKLGEDMEKENELVEEREENDYKQSPLNEILGEFGNMERDVKDQKNQTNSQENGLLIVKQEEEGNEHLPRVSIEIDLMPNEIEKPNEEPKKKIEKNSEKQENICRICNVQFNSSIQMIPIPSKKEDLIKFWNVFEQNFIDNILKYPEPHFICMSHVLEQNWKNC
ncbi:unnamed protein product [Caenorhabditis angaria]|uniref:THAP-type domain-containing protein n=1 Tax=Caenorhabditis angaria TaxID=860376 RepID=A0A9P1I4V7_9PELO|nr:unnamed protein product [Caenorhabditis angaria]